MTYEDTKAQKGLSARSLRLALLGALSLVLLAIGRAIYRTPSLQSALLPEYVAGLAVTVALWIGMLGTRKHSRWQTRERNLFRDVTTLGRFFAALIGFGFYLVVRIGWSSAVERHRLLFVILLWGLAFLTLGGLLGFLFGIPRTLTGSVNDRSAEAQRAGSTTYQVNTNLERVSDWLTQVIVGGTVTQLALFPKYWERVGEHFATSIGMPPAGVWRITGASSALFFLVVGFLASYLLTRLYLAGAIQRADGFGEAKVQHLSNLSNEELQMLEATSLYLGDEPPSFTPQAKEAAQKVRQLPLSELTYWRDLRVWAKAQLAEGKLKEAGDAYVRALAIVPNDAELRLGYAIALGEADAEKTLVLAQLEQARDSLMPSSHVDLRKNVFKSLMYAQLFLKRPESFQKVLASAKEYFGSKGAVQSAGILFNVACAYGQAHRWLTEDRSRRLRAGELAYLPDDPRTDAQEVISEEELVALTATTLRSAIERDECYRIRLADMLAGKLPKGDDFQSLASEPTITRLATPTA